MVKSVQFIVGLILLIALEIFRVYFIMPFPGSQKAETIELAYFIHTNIFYFRLIGMLIIIFPVIHFYWIDKTKAKWWVSIALVFYIFIVFMFNFRFLADKMFLQPKLMVFRKSSVSIVKKDQLVLGIHYKNEAHAYPLEIIGYHHQVRDTIAGEPMMITYCTVCRTGRVFSPKVNGKPEQFRLVGMDHFNAMFEDATTGSWWRQVSGEAIAGPLKGSTLAEIPAEQMSLRAWLEQYPDSYILQPDSNFSEKYKDLAEFDEGTIESSLEKKDSLSWKDKSWIVGVQIGMHARAYDWNDLIEKRIINDTLAKIPIAVVLENDSSSFHVWKRDTLSFMLNSGASQLIDLQTKSLWNWDGKCVEGTLKDKKLQTLQSYQEFWHSWKTFRPQTTQYKPKK